LDDDNVTSDRNPTFTVTNYQAVTDDADNVSVKWFVDDAEQAGEIGATFTPSALSDGEYVVTAQFTDVSGNITDSNAITVKIKEDYPMKMEFIEIGKGALSGNASEGVVKSNMVINNTNDRENLITQMNSVNNVADNFSETVIAFDHYMVLAVF